MQYDRIVELVQGTTPDSFLLTPQILLELHRLAIQDIYSCAGRFRTGPVTLSDGRHSPPPYQQVPPLVDEMCQYVNDDQTRSPIHLAAYLMWRHNWIHPFFGGNGRTSRAVSYLVLCSKLGYILPGQKTVTDQIVANRGPYHEALHAADDAARDGITDVSKMEEMLSNMLAAQLYYLHQRATGMQ